MNFKRLPSHELPAQCRLRVRLVVRDQQRHAHDACETSGLEQRAARPGRADDDPLGTFEQVACGGQGRRQLDLEALLHLGDAAGEAANRNDALRVKGVEEGFVIGRRLGRIEQEDAASSRGADAGGKADQLFIAELAGEIDDALRRCRGRR